MKVLLVDDNEINLEIQKIMLESCSLEVDAAESGDAAVGLAAAEHYDMIFMDIQMPGMDGFQAASIIRQTNSDVPIIALSADKIPYDDRRFISSGMNGSIRKPLQQSDLQKLLSGYLNLEHEEASDTSDVIFDSDKFSALIPDTASASQILEQFFTVHGDDCAMLKERVNSGNILGARELMHDIVGISGNLYCNQLYAAAIDLGAELRQGCSDSLDAFTDVWEQTVSELKAYCSSLAGSVDTETVEGDWDVVWSDFIGLCQEFDVSAVSLFSRNLNLFSSRLSAEEFEHIRNAVQRYDFLSIIMR